MGRKHQGNNVLFTMTHSDHKCVEKRGLMDYVLVHTYARPYNNFQGATIDFKKNYLFEIDRHWRTVYIIKADFRLNTFSLNSCCLPSVKRPSLDVNSVGPYSLLKYTL